MKRYADDPKRNAVEPRTGYLAKCEWCGLMVIHTRKTRKPFHMHRYSKKCQELGEKLRKKS